MRLSRCLYWKSGNLFDRMSDEGHFLAHLAAQVFDPDGSFGADFQQEVEMPSSLLVVDHLDLQSPWQDPLIVAGLLAALVERFTDNYYAVVLPTGALSMVAGAALLHQAAVLLAADEFGEDLLLIDTSLARPEEAVRAVRARLQSRSHDGPAGLDDEDEDEYGDEDGEGWMLSPRTAALLALALDDLSRRAWEEAAALGDEALSGQAAGLFADLPRITRRLGGSWRREMARSFDDLASDIAAGRAPLPRCTGEEMALHLAIRRAEELLQDRPKLVAERIAGLPFHRFDMDLDGASDMLLQDHDVLMLFDASLDGAEDPQSEVKQALGLVSLAPLKWFSPFDHDEARDPARGYRTP
ncbi:hypothetical protein ABT263_37715 [Kitasatospora sp. NPDC001603]|uniref:hypothetical protein n=1 Tax=Kitasatospora sp. NPDC001603 TaxID=3154388 RepID=UPI003322BB93